MTIYLDTSLIISALSAESHSPLARIALSESFARDPHISRWVITEFAAALSVKVRTGSLTALDRARLQGQFASYHADAWAILPVSNRHFDDAAALAGRPGIALKSGDALHLAITADRRAEIWTLDKGLSDCAASLGIPARLI